VVIMLLMVNAAKINCNGSIGKRNVNGCKFRTGTKQKAPAWKARAV